jgi:hypothetical protein
VKTRRSEDVPGWDDPADEAEAVWQESEDPGHGDTQRTSAGLRLPQTTRASVKLLELDQGLYALKIGAVRGETQEVFGLSLPAVQITAPPAESGDSVEIVAISGIGGGWLGSAGGTVVVKSPRAGGHVLITTFLPPNQAEAPVAIEISRLDGPGPEPSGASLAQPVPMPARRVGTADIGTEILLHVERVGDRRFPGEGWVGSRGSKLRIEAFSIRPLERVSPGDIEFKAFAPSGRETAWVSDGKLCGTRGRQLPLTGFAIRVAPHLQDRVDVIYQGSFFVGGTSEPFRNGERCMSSIADDPLEAMNVRLIDRRPAGA